MGRVDAIRRFNRFYTRRIGVLEARYLGSPFPLPQARVLYELGQRGVATASELGAELDLDLGYLSRLVQSLRRQGLLTHVLCLDRHERLSPGQRMEIDRVYRSYPHLNDDVFVEQHLDEWLRD